MANTSKKLRILLADDHELVRRGIRELLRARRGWRVVAEAANGREAVERAAKLRPDLAVLDIGMPALDGVEATRQIRAASSNTRVLILTMHESEQMVRRVLEAGARGYVLKSDVAAHLVKAVTAVAHGKVFLTPKVSEIILSGFLGSEKTEDSEQSSSCLLTPRELEVTQLLADGKANKEIASELGISVRTVEAHRAKAMSKLGLHSIAELVRYALRKGMSSIHHPDGQTSLSQLGIGKSTSRSQPARK
jgi:DNA-binding NarL/FixJ family response regulator